MTLKKLLLLAVALVLMLFSQADAASVDTVKAAIVKYSVEMGVDPAITLSIAKAESGFRHETRSSHGAVGVFQLLPSTARRMGLNPYSLDDNIKAGIMYYKSMYKMFGSMELAVAAYNAGPANVKKYNAIPPFRETKRFVSLIMSDYYYLKAHTDPAIVAYNKAQKAKKQLSEQKQKQASVQTSQVAQVQSQQAVVDIPKINIVPKFVATAPSVTKAPVPIEKAKSVGQSDILDSQIDVDM
ncbi:lytic transglycosylase domain-containing protein [bacterium]|nr:lytic transglycosylase domain-containing protein [bacterium]